MFQNFAAEDCGEVQRRLHWRPGDSVENFLVTEVEAKVS
jgi:hypothetical protein